MFINTISLLLKYTIFRIIIHTRQINRNKYDHAVGVPMWLSSGLLTGDDVSLMVMETMGTGGGTGSTAPMFWARWML